jgi:hypothetical protein
MRLDREEWKTRWKLRTHRIRLTFLLVPGVAMIGGFKRNAG